MLLCFFSSAGGVSQGKCPCRKRERNRKTTPGAVAAPGVVSLYAENAVGLMDGRFRLAAALQRLADVAVQQTAQAVDVGIGVVFHAVLQPGVGEAR